jgi:serine protease AprX
VAAQLPAADLKELADEADLTVTPDAPVRLAARNKQLWPYACGIDKLWGSWTNPAPQAPAIAVVDSGIESDRDDFSEGRRIAARVNLTSLTPNSSGDGRGHGTFVAGIAAGSGEDYAGAAPNANIVALDVMDDYGMARTSDVIAAAQWIVANRAKYNIRAANFSLHATNPSNFTRDPLDKAVEKLWFNGVVVVTAAGNYGTASGPSGVKYAPGNDPFVITVGAIDLKGTYKANAHVTAPWSAYGYTYDGFAKPELVAPGRYMIGPIPAKSTLAKERAEQLIGGDDEQYIQLSGTSFAAPVVAGIAAQLLARHPRVDARPGEGGADADSAAGSERYAAVGRGR